MPSMPLTATLRSSVRSHTEDAGGWRTPAVMKKHLGSTCDAFAISRPLINDSGIVNRWMQDPDHLTGCVSCNKCQKGQGIVVCRKDELR